ncbi:MAG: hypothetical protein L3J57_02355 [Desulfuromusa sp.]|nr:hypothetical protein [Desulfuromusa sp.]
MKLNAKITKVDHSRFLKSMRPFFSVVMAVLFVVIPFASSPGLAAYYNTDFDSTPPFISTYVKPNVLFVLDNSNSMDEDVDGAAVGSDAINSKSEIARNAIAGIIDLNKNTMRFGLMAYKQAGIVRYQIHNSPYYCDYDPAHYDPAATPTPKDPTTNAKRHPNPVDPGNYVYYDTALPMYSTNNLGTAYCYSSDFTYDDPGTCTEANQGSCHTYRCYRTKTGVLATPMGATIAELEGTYGYSNYWFTSLFYPTDSDIAAGYHEFGLEMSWVHVGDTWFSNSSPGSGMLHSAIEDSSTTHITDLTNLLATSQFATATDIPLRNAGLTPLSGTIESARKYFEGNLPAAEAAAGVSLTTPVQLRCQQNFVVLVTDGLPSTDKDGNIGDTDDLIAELEAEITALRSTSVTGFTDDFDIQTYVIGFAIPEAFGDKLDTLAVAGGTAIDGHALLANNAAELAAKLQEVFIQISTKVSSGTSASVISNTRSGEGAIYQSVFYPERTDNNHNTVNWVGQLHALFIDDHGNMREDTVQDGVLDLATDMFIVYNGDTVEKYLDVGANGIFDHNELAEGPEETGFFDSIKYLWSSSDWLNPDTGGDALDPLTPRSYTNLAKQRHIFTFIDDGDMLAESGEIIDFSPANVATIAPYLHVFDPFAYSAASPPPGIVSDAADHVDFDTFVALQPEREIAWVRGQDQAEFAFGAKGSVIPAMRSRYYQDNVSGADKTWRMGDIVNSTPTVVGRPAENFDLLYYDRTFSSYFSKYKNRRNVVYVGGNDGMFHAFNAGFYDKIHRAYLQRPKVWDSATSTYIDDTSKINFDLGAEMWAYIPQNLLPHLYWLTKSDYKHVYYNDLKPKVFDANIFANDADHPGGWGTVLIGGMRFGGGKINIDKNHDGTLDAVDDKAMTSAYFVFDITNPEVAPKLLAEFTLPGLGYTTNYPTVVTLRDSGWSNLASPPTNNDWYLLFGSGPANAAGEPDTTALDEAASDQDGKIFLLNLNKLASGTKEVCFMNATGSCVKDDLATPAFEPEALVTLDGDSFISDAIGVDWDIDFKNDAVYFGTVTGDEITGWGGKLRRIVVDDNPIISTWSLDNTFINLSPGSVSGETTGQPITAAPTAGLDKQGNRWLYVGTGRYLTAADIANTDQQSYYGLKEPRDTSGFLYTTLNRNTTDLFDSTAVKVYDGGSDVAGIASGANYTLLQTTVRAKKGWFMDFPDAKERNIGQATLLGKILTFTSFIPSADPCESGGESWVYVLDYETGTAYKNPVIGTDSTDVTTGSDNVSGKEKILKRQLIGDGLATSPGLHTGRESGAKAFIQSSTGEIKTFEEKTPGRTKSGMSSWQAE